MEISSHSFSGNAMQYLVNMRDADKPTYLKDVKISRERTSTVGTFTHTTDHTLAVEGEPFSKPVVWLRCVATEIGFLAMIPLSLIEGVARLALAIVTIPVALIQMIFMRKEKDEMTVHLIVDDDAVDDVSQSRHNTEPYDLDETVTGKLYQTGIEALVGTLAAIKAVVINLFVKSIKENFTDDDSISNEVIDAIHERLTNDSYMEMFEGDYYFENRMPHGYQQVTNSSDVDPADRHEDDASVGGGYESDSSNSSNNSDSSSVYY